MSQILRVDVENSGSGDGGGRGRFQVSNFEQKAHGGIERNSLVRRQGQNFVVVHDGVERLDPHGVDIPVQQNPFRTGMSYVRQLSHHVTENARTETRKGGAVGEGEKLTMKNIDQGQNEQTKTRRNGKQ